MPIGTLLGGESLKSLITVVEPNAHRDPASIVITAEPKRLFGELVARSTGGNRVTEALDVIRKDLSEKWQEIDSFVSIRIHTGTQFWRLRRDTDQIDLAHNTSDLTAFYELHDGEDRIALAPHEFILCRTLEWLELPANVAAFIQSRTTIAMCGIDVTATNQIVPSYDGDLFLEIKNQTNKTICIPRFAALAEMFFCRTEGQFSGTAQTLRRAEANLPIVQIEERQSKQSLTSRIVLSVIAALLGAAFTASLLFVEDYRIRISILVAAGVGVFVLLFNHEYWHRRCAAGLFALGGIPQLGFTIVASLTSDNESVAKFDWIVKNNVSIGVQVASIIAAVIIYMWGEWLRTAFRKLR